MPRTAKGIVSSRHQGRIFCHGSVGAPKILDFGLAKLSPKPVTGTKQTAATFDVQEHLTSPRHGK